MSDGVKVRLGILGCIAVIAVAMDTLDGFWLILLWWDS